MTDLNKNELEAMRVLWEKGALKPADIQEEFEWPIENATLRSVLRLLVEKGHARREKKGKAYFYRASASRGSLLDSMAQRMARVFSGGSAADLIAQLIRAEELSDEEIETLRQLAASKGQDTDAEGEDA